MARARCACAAGGVEVALAPVDRRSARASVERPGHRGPSIAAQHAAGALADLGDDLGRQRVDLRLGHGLVARLDRHRDGDRLLAGLDALALVDVEHRDAGDQLAVHRLRGAHDVGGLHRAIDHEGEVARHRLERRQLQHGLGARRLGLALGDAFENDLEGDQRALGVERLQRARMQLAEMAEHVLRADLDGAGAAGMEPGRPAGHDLHRLRRRAGRGQHRERVGLGVEGVDRRRPCPTSGGRCRWPWPARGARRSPP